MRRAGTGLVWASLLGLAACDQPNAAPSQQAKALPKAAANPLAKVPSSIVGSWKLTGEECDPEGEPSARLPAVSILFFDDFRYELNVEGWIMPGNFRIDQFRDSPLRIQMADTMYNFTLENGRLENWSEGDAVYLCGRIFERDE